MATEAKRVTFSGSKLKVDDSVTTLPGFGIEMEAKLKPHNLATVGRLMGQFMTLNLDKEAFIAELATYGVTRQCVRPRTAPLGTFPCARAER